MVIHAAGVVDDGPLLTKTSGGVEEVFAPKVHGVQILHDLFPDGSIDRLVLFSSTSTVTAPAGQVDYVAANEFLNAYARSRAAGARRCWRSTGASGTKSAWPPSRWPAGWANRNRHRGTRPVPRCWTRRPSTPRLTGCSPPAGKRPTAGSSTATAPRPARRCCRAPATWNSQPRPFAGNGETGPSPSATSTSSAPWRCTTARPARCAQGWPAATKAMRSKCAATCCSRGARLPAQRAGHAGARGVAAHLPRIDTAAVEARCPHHRASDPKGLRSPQEEHLNFGPRWRVLQSVAYGDNEGSRCCSAGGIRKRSVGGLPAAPGAAGPGHRLGDAPDQRLQARPPLGAGVLPDGQGAPALARHGLELGAQRPGPTAPMRPLLSSMSRSATRRARCASRCRVFRSSDWRKAAFPPRSARWMRAIWCSRRAPGATGGTRSCLPAEEQLQHLMSQGILPHEGADAFGRALATGLPQVVISSVNLDALVQQGQRGRGHRRRVGSEIPATRPRQRLCRARQ